MKRKKRVTTRQEQEIVAWIARGPGGTLLPFSVRNTRGGCYDDICCDLCAVGDPRPTRAEMRRRGYRVEKCVVTTDPDITDAR